MIDAICFETDACGHCALQPLEIICQRTSLKVLLDMERSTSSNDKTSTCPYVLRNLLCSPEAPSGPRGWRGGCHVAKPDSPRWPYDNRCMRMWRWVWTCRTLGSIPNICYMYTSAERPVKSRGTWAKSFGRGVSDNMLKPPNPSLEDLEQWNIGGIDTSNVGDLEVWKVGDQHLLKHLGKFQIPDG